MEFGVADGLEAQAVVEGDGAVIGFDDPEPGAGAFGAVEGEEMGEEGGAEASAGMGGVGAEGADFSPGVGDEALAAHGEEGAIGGADAEIAAHAAGLGAEVAGVGDGDEVEHFGAVGAGEGFDRAGGWGGKGGVFGEDHLEAGDCGLPSDGRGVGWWLGTEKVGGFAGFEEGGQIFEGFGGGVFEGGEGGDVGGVAAGVDVGLSEVGVGGGEGFPDDGGEWVGKLRHGCHAR